MPPVDPPNNINWLRVGKVAGDIADEVYRIDTIGGQPPTSVSLLLLLVGRDRSLMSSPRSALMAKTVISA